MKIDQEVEKLICDAAGVANDVGVTAFVIDEEGIRGMDEGKLIFMLRESFDLEVPFASLAIGDTAQFIQRYNIHKTNDGSELILEVDKDDKAKVISMKSKGLNIDFRCIKPERIRAPKKLDDVEYCAFELPDAAIDMIKKGSTTMKAEEVLFVKEEDSDSVYLEMVDINRSSFKYDIDGFVEPVNPKKRCSFAKRYPVKTILMALRNSDNNHLLIGEKGSLTICKNQIDIIIAPRV